MAPGGGGGERMEGRLEGASAGAVVGGGGGSACSGSGAHGRPRQGISLVMADRLIISR